MATVITRIKEPDYRWFGIRHEENFKGEAQIVWGSRMVDRIDGEATIPGWIAEKIVGEIGLPEDREND